MCKALKNFLNSVEKTGTKKITFADNIEYLEPKDINEELKNRPNFPKQCLCFRKSKNGHFGIVYFNSEGSETEIKNILRENPGLPKESIITF